YLQRYFFSKNIISLFLISSAAFSANWEIAACLKTALEYNNESTLYESIFTKLPLVSNFKDVLSITS
ncbi:MAG: hypothetical protein ACKO96_48815, partial [Flammeovirgaceae bacterium]